MHLEFHANGRSLGVLTDSEMLVEFRDILQKAIPISLDGKQVILNVDFDDRDAMPAIHLNMESRVEITVKDKGEVIMTKNLTMKEFDALNTGSLAFDIRLVRKGNVRFLEKPSVAGEFSTGDHKTGHGRFSITEVTETNYRRVSLSDLGINDASGTRPAEVKVVVKRNAYDKFLLNRKYSLSYEEGGFFIGEVFSDVESDDGYIILISDSVEASHVGASYLQLIFTGETFSQVKKLLRTDEMAGKKLLGWYHTHLFPAGMREVELSGQDLNLHFSTFRFPWQVAGLINLERNNYNTLRFYSRRGEQWEMKLNPFWIID